MSILDYFKPIDSIAPDEVRKLLSDESHGDYNLVDVRQPREYEQGHLPGAVLIPLGELQERIGELDPSKPTVVY